MFFLSFVENFAKGNVRFHVIVLRGRRGKKDQKLKHLVGYQL